MINELIFTNYLLLNLYLNIFINTNIQHFMWKYAIAKLYILWFGWNFVLDYIIHSCKYSDRLDLALSAENLVIEFQLPPLMILCWWKPRSNLNVFISIYVTLCNFNGSYIKKYCFEIPSRDFKSIKINCNIGFQALYQNMNPTYSIMQWKYESFQWEMPCLKKLKRWKILSALRWSIITNY